MISKTAGKYLQNTYAAVVHAIQPEWIFLHCETKETGCAIAGVENLLWENVFPRLLFIKSKYLPPIVWTLTVIPVNKLGLGLQNLAMSADEKFRALQCASTELIRDVTGESEFSSIDNL